MSKFSKAGVTIAAGVGAALLTLGGCASQQSGAATPQNLPNNCAVYAQPAPASCKGLSTCKAQVVRHHHHKVVQQSTTTTTTTEAAGSASGTSTAQ